MFELSTTQGLNYFIKRRISEEMSGYDAWVLIWYLHDDCVGHASMFIGDISSNSQYVSWWPAIRDNKVFFKKSPARVEKMDDGSYKTSSYELDYQSEHRAPDVIYGLKNLNTRSMVTSWLNICSKEPPPTFRTTGKNCADIVQRVIKAGLCHSPLRHYIFGFMDGEFYIHTPKRVAVICNKLRDNNMAVKIKVRARHGFMPVQSLLRLR